MPILNGSEEDLKTSTTHLSNSMSQDVKPTNYLLCNSKNIKMLLMLLTSLELNQPEVKPPVKLQSSLKLKVNTPVNSLNTNTCSKLKLLTNSSNKILIHPKVLKLELTNKPLMTSLTLMTLHLEERNLVTMTTQSENSILNHSNPLSIPQIQLVTSTKKLELCLTDSKKNLKKVPPPLKKTKSKPLLTPLNIKLKPPLKLSPFTLMPKKEKLTSKNLLLISKLP